jgi:hypothetical protein
MPVFIVRRRVDAFVDYVTNIEAATPDDAVWQARELESELSWKMEGPCEFDARQFLALDDDGTEIDGTQLGDF